MSKMVCTDTLELGTSGAYLLSGTIDPSGGAGVAAPIGSFYLRNGTLGWFMKTGAADTDWEAQVFTGTQGLGYFGDGSDGDVVINGSVALTRDMYYDNLTVENGGDLDTNAYRIWVKNTLHIQAGGHVHCDGAPASGPEAGAERAGGTLIGNSRGSSGASAAVGSAARYSLYCIRDFAGWGGKSGDDFYVRGVITERTTNLGNIQSLTQALTWNGQPTNQVTGSIYQITAGTGGGGGRNTPADPAGHGGGGGAAGGTVIISARMIINEGSISADGGVGGSGGLGGLSTEAYGGGGGGGGLIILVRRTFSGTAPTVAGANGGGGAGPGVGGFAGLNGMVVHIDV